MRPAKTASAEDYALMSSFEEMRQQLLDERYADRWDKTLAFWTLPKDRRLPYALLDRKVGEIVHSSFRDLAATSGIGRKKIAALVMLLQRVVAQQPHFGNGEAGPSSDVDDATDDGPFVAGDVSESVWQRWQETIQRHGLEHTTLGRLAASLRQLPTVIWETPFSEYLHLTMGEMRGLRTHGDKRIRVVLEIFHSVHQLLGSTGNPRHLRFRLLPRFIEPLEQWILAELRSERLPEMHDLRQNLVLPLLNQIELDAGESVHRLAAGRLGIEGPAESVREQSRRMDVTRARVYQLLDTCARVLAVRWPEGRWQLASLEKKLGTLPLDDERRALLREANLLFFPERPTAPSGKKVRVGSSSRARTRQAIVATAARGSLDAAHH
jgi:hypothetical protein